MVGRARIPGMGTANPNTRVARMPNPSGYQRSHAIPEVLETSAFYRDVESAVDTNGRHIFDIQSAIDNGQPLPARSTGAAAAAPDLSQHQGPHPRVNDIVREYFDDWETEFRTQIAALDPVADAARIEEIRAGFAMRARNLSDAIKALSIGGYADANDTALRLIYNASDTNAASAIPHWDELTAAERQDAIEAYDRTLLSRVVGADGALATTTNAAGELVLTPEAARLKIIRDLTRGAVGQIRPADMALVDQVYAVAAREGIDLTTTDALEVTRRFASDFEGFGRVLQKFNVLRALAPGAELFLSVVDAAMWADTAINVGTILVGAALGDVTFGLENAGAVEPKQLLADLVGPHQRALVTDLPSPPNNIYFTDSTFTTVDTLRIEQWVRETFPLPYGWQWGFEDQLTPGAPPPLGTVPRAYAYDPNAALNPLTGLPVKQRIYFDVPPGSEMGNGPPPTASAYRVTTLENGDVVYEDSQHHTVSVVRGPDAQEYVQDLIDARTATTQADRDAALAAARDADVQVETGVSDGSSSPSQELVDHLRFNLNVGHDALNALMVGWHSLFDGTIHFSDLGSIFASILMRELPISNPLERIGVSTGLSAILSNIGQALDIAGQDALHHSLGSYLQDAFSDFPDDLQQTGAGAISSYLIGEVLDAAGVTGDTAEAAQAFAGPAIGNIAYNLLHLGEELNPTYYTTVDGEIIKDAAGQPIPRTAPAPANAADRSWNTGLNTTFFATIAADFIGSKLADAIFEFETVSGQIGAAVGESIGAIIAAKVLASGLNPVTFAIAVVIVAISKLVGGTIGSWFGGTPKSGAALTWDANTHQFAVGNVWSKHGGSKDAVRSLAGNVGELLNGVVDITGATVLDPGHVRTGAYDTKGKDFIYKADASGSYALRTKKFGQIISHGQYIALSDLSTRLAGGDIFIKRAISSALEGVGGDPSDISHFTAQAFDAQTLMGDIAIAQSYSAYWDNRIAINGLIQADDQTAFAATWVASIAAALELGLNKRFASDWIGGWSVFLDGALDGSVDGQAFSAANVSMQFDVDSNERNYVFLDQYGEYYGVLDDTIDAADKTIVRGSGNADAITVASASWSEGVTTTRSVHSAQGDTTVEEQQTVSRTGWRLDNTAGLTVDGALQTGGPSKEIKIAAVLDGGAGSDTIRGGDLGNDLLGGEGDDVLVGGKLDDWEFGGDGDDKLFAGDVADPSSVNEALQTSVDGGNGDYLEGGAGDDTLYGGKGSDWLSGGDGVDRLVGGDGGDILDGGAGNDQGANGAAALLGGAGSDQYVFNLHSGQDVIYDDGDGATQGTNLFSLTTQFAAINAGTAQRNWAGGGDYTVDGSVLGGEDAISFGAGIDLRDLVIQRSESGGVAGNDLIIEIKQDNVVTGDSITIKDWFDVTRRVEWLRFANGEEIRIGDISSFIIGEPGQVVVRGTGGNDFIYGDDGDNEIYGLAGNDFGYGGLGNDLVSGDENNDWVMGGKGNDQVLGADGNDTDFGDDGDDTVDGGSGDDIVVGGRGNDTVVGGLGNDLFRFSRGDGRDVMYDDSSATLELVAEGDVGDTAHNGDGDLEFFNGYEKINGKVVQGGQTYFDGGWSGDYVWDDTSQKLYRQVAVEGAKTADAGEDTLQFDVGIDLDDVQVRRVGDDLILSIANTDESAAAFSDIRDQIKLQEWYLAGVGQAIETFSFTEVGSVAASTYTFGASSLATSTDGDDTLAGSAGKDWITGGLGDDVIDAQGGSDILAGNAGGDSLLGGAGDDVLYGGVDNDALDGGLGADQLIGGDGVDIASYASDTGTVGAGLTASLAHSNINSQQAAGDVYTGIEGLEGTNRNDTLVGDDGDNVLIGSGGGDFLDGGRGDDSYEYDIGDGADVIRDRAADTQVIVDGAGALNTAEFTGHWTSLGTEKIFNVVWYYYALSVTRNSDGAVVYASEDFSYVGPHTTMAPPGSWPLDGWTEGAERSGNGLETVLAVADPDESGGYDSLDLGVGITLSDITAARDGNDVVLSFAQGGSVRLQQQAIANTAVEELNLGDLLSANLGSLKLAGEAASDGDDLYLGGAGADTFNGGLGDDVISGGASADSLSGGAGDDILEGGAGNDTLDGGADSTDASIVAGQDMTLYGDYVRYVGASAGVVVDLNLSANVGSATIGSEVDTLLNIENVIGSQFGDTISGDDGANRLAGLDGGDVLSGLGGDDVLDGGAGADTLTGGDGVDALHGEDGDDVLHGGAGGDQLFGGDGVDQIQGDDGDDNIAADAGDDVSVHGNLGKDTISGGAGADHLFGDEGDDVLVGDDGDDILEGGDGNDKLAGALGDDTLKGGAGDDVYTFDAQSNDQIIDAAGQNAIVMDGVTFDKLWLSKVGDDLRIGVIGATAALTVKDYFAASNPSVMYSIAAGDQVLYLRHAGDLIDAMTTALATGTPSVMDAAITATLADYWFTDGRAPPKVTDQSVSTNEDTALTGSVAAEDNDDQTLSYVLATAPAHGGVELDPDTGAWTFTPALNWFGTTSFVVTVTDTDGLASDQTVIVTVNSVGDTPTSISASGTLHVSEDAASGTTIGTFSSTDPDTGDTASYSLVDNAGGRFAISAAGVLTLVGGVDYESAHWHSITVRVTDGGGATFDQTFTVNVDDAVDVFTGTAAAETIYGQNGRDIIYGLAGADTLAGGAGDDDLYGGDDNDVLQGSTGADNLDGGAGDDFLTGGPGADHLTGGAGVDTLSYGTSGAGVNVNLSTGAASGGDAAGDVFVDSFEALEGSGYADTLTGADVAQTLKGAGGDDSIVAGSGADTLYGGAGNDSISAGAGADIVWGGDGNDILQGGAGANQLTGEAGDDTLTAGDDGDTLTGGLGSDALTGGAGIDCYVFTATSGHDTITGFVSKGANADFLNFSGIDIAHLWFAKSGDNLEITVIGQTTQVTLVNWFTASDGGDTLVILGTGPVYAASLANLMAGYTKPSDNTGLNALTANESFHAPWTEYVSHNEAPAFASVAPLTIDEQAAAITTPLNVVDDSTSAASLHYTVEVFNDSGLTSPNTSVLSATTPFTVAGSAGSQTLTLNQLPHVSGVFHVRVRAFDATYRMSEQVFTLTINPIATTPTLSLVQAQAATLDSGSLGLNIQANLNDLDGSETLSVTIAGIPAGLSLNNNATRDPVTGLFTLTAAQLSGLAITGSATWATDLSLTITAIATESAGGTASVSTTLSVPINARPTDIIAPSPLSVNENASSGTVIGTFTRTDGDGAGDTPSYSFAVVNGVTQNAGGRFAINASTGQLTVAAGAVLDYEASHTQSIRLRVTDSGGLWYEKDFTIAINDQNEAPTALSFANTTTTINELTGASPVTAAHVKVADINLTDDALGTNAFSLSGTDAASFEIISGVLYLKSGVTLNYESKTSFVVTVSADDNTVGTTPDQSQTFTLNVANVNEAPVISGYSTSASGASWNSGTKTLTIPETTQGAGAVIIANVAASDVDAGTTLTYSLTGANASMFSIDSSGNIRLVTPIDYEAATHSFSLGVRVSDGVAPVDDTITVAASNVNEAPVMTGAYGYSVYSGPANKFVSHKIDFTIADPEGGTSFTWLVKNGATTLYSGATGGSKTIVLVNNALASSDPGWPEGLTITVQATDSTSVQTTYYVDTGTGGPLSYHTPVVLDLDGDGVSLVSVNSSTAAFDMDDDGLAQKTGWVGPNDGMLVLDRDNDGLIDHSNEISFGSDVAHSVSDMEGLRAFDTNHNGFFDGGDAQFADFKIWRDADQDGISQANELSSLADLDIVAINLTLSLTGATTEGATDNVIHGTAAFVRGDGATGDVGDVYLAYRQDRFDLLGNASHLPPIIFDLDGNGISLVSRSQSNVLFDVNGDGDKERTGWFAAGDGVLALDRNGDGLISSGNEISFAQDLPGAQTDLEGLRAFDTNKNGFLDAGDQRFADFRIWQDVNQDGISQSDELLSLNDRHITALNLTANAVDASASGGGDNIIHATANYVRDDGAIGLAGDVFLAYGDANNNPLIDVDRQASGHRTSARTPPRRPNWIDNAAIPENLQSFRDWLSHHGFANGLDDPWRGGPSAHRHGPGAPAPSLDDGEPTAPDAYQPNQAPTPPSALHSGLSVADQRVLHMITAMASFDVQDPADLYPNGRQKDPRVAALLTSLPEAR